MQTTVMNPEWLTQIGWPLPFTDTKEDFDGSV